MEEKEEIIIDQNQNEELIIETPKKTLLEKIKENYYVNKLKNISHIAILVVISSVAGIVLQTVDIIFLGHLGSKEMAAGALASSISLAFYFLIIGFESALDTFFSQSYGAKNFQVMGVLLQRGIIMLSVLYIPISLFLFFIEYYMLILGQDPELSKMTGNFVRILIPGYYPYLIHGVITQLLNSQHLMWPNVVALISENILNAILNYLLIFGLPGTNYHGIGFYGSPISTSISRLFGFLLLLAICFIKKFFNNVWFGLQIKKALNLKGIWNFLKIGLPGSVMFNFEAWVYLVGTPLPASYLGEEYISANSIVLSISTLTFMFPLGLGVASSVSIGNALGQGDSKGAKSITRISFVLTCFICGFFGLWIGTLHQYIGWIFTNDPRVVEIAGNALIALAVNILVDGIQGVYSGVLRGMGRQLLGATINFISYYVIGIPAGLVFAFWFRWHLFGIYAGLVCAATTSTIILFIYINFIVNWDKEVELTKKRLEAEAMTYEEEKSLEQKPEEIEKLEENPQEISKDIDDSGIKDYENLNETEKIDLESKKE